MQKSQTQAEQRKGERFEHDSELRVESPARVPAISGRMQNFSSGGFYFESDAFIPQGKTILIGIYNSPYSEAPMTYQCQRVRIQWCRQLKTADPRFGYGVEKLSSTAGTLSVPPNETIDEGASPAEVHTSKDRRENTRKAFLSSVYFVCDRKYYAGVTKDISSGGLFIRIEKTLEIGQILHLSIPNTAYEKGNMLRAKIVHLESDGIGVKIVGILKPKAKRKTRLDEKQKSR